jgi:hypothetical protein
MTFVKVFYMLHLPMSMKKAGHSMLFELVCSFTDDCNSDHRFFSGIHAQQQPSTVEGLFGSSYDLIEYFMCDANEQMATYMADMMQT